jgi:hypothetical protein
LKAVNKQDTILYALEVIIEFLKRSAEDPNRSGEVLKNAVGLLGDLGQTYGNKMLPIYQQQFIAKLIEEAYQNGTDAQETARWAHSVSLSCCLVIT